MNQVNGLYEFGPFRLDAAQRLLTRSGETVLLAPKTLDLLLILVGSKGRALTKQELMSALWPDAFVEEANLPFQISTLRKSLGEQGAKWIETLPRHGYRFTAPVSEIQSHRAPTRSMWLPLVIIAVAVAALLAVVSLNRPSHGPLVATALTTYPGDERHPTFSPDGTQVAFSWNGPDQQNYDIYVKALGAESPHRLTSHAAEDSSPSWSPDGQWIAFLRRLPEAKAAVVLISPVGGPERTIGETPTLTSDVCSCYRSLAWSPDSKRLALMQKSTDDASVGLFLVSIETGEKQRLTRPPAGAVADTDPAFSPDGGMLAFTRASGALTADLYVVELAPDLRPVREPRRLTFDNRFVDSPAWTADNRQIIFSSNRSGSGDLLWRIDAVGGNGPRRVDIVGENAENPAVSSRGDRLVYTARSLDANVWRIQLPADPLHTPSAPLTSDVIVASTRFDAAARYSPDGARIAFSSNRSGSHQVWISAADGANPTQLTNMGSVTSSPRWSPAGEQIAFDSNAEGHFEVYVMPAAGGKPRRLTYSNGDSAVPSWSRDGKFIYFSSTRNGESQVWKSPSAGGDAVQITKRGGFTPIESPDGNFLYFMKTDDLLSYTKGQPAAGIWRVPVGGGEEVRIVESAMQRTFDLVPDGIYFFLPSGHVETQLRYFHLATGKTTLIETIRAPVFHYIDVSLDGRRLLYTRRDRDVGDLMLVDRFR